MKTAITTEKKARLKARLAPVVFSVLLCACALAATATAMAQTVYRCGTTYQHRPCAGGTALQPDDARSQGQRTQSIAASRRDARMADAMEKLRLKEEAQPVSAYIPAPPASTQTAAARKPVKAKPEKSGAPTATEPGSSDGKPATGKKKAEKEKAEKSRAV